MPHSLAVEGLSRMCVLFSLGWDCQFRAEINKTTEIRDSITFPGDLLDAGAAVHVTRSGCGVVGVIDNPIFLALR